MVQNLQMNAYFDSSVLSILNFFRGQVFFKMTRCVYEQSNGEILSDVRICGSAFYDMKLQIEYNNNDNNNNDNNKNDNNNNDNNNSTNRTNSAGFSCNQILNTQNINDQTTENLVKIYSSFEKIYTDGNTHSIDAFKKKENFPNATASLNFAFEFEVKTDGKAFVYLCEDDQCLELVLGKNSMSFLRAIPGDESKTLDSNHSYDLDNVNYMAYKVAIDFDGNIKIYPVTEIARQELNEQPRNTEDYLINKYWKINYRVNFNPWLQVEKFLSHDWFKNRFNNGINNIRFASDNFAEWNILYRDDYCHDPTKFYNLIDFRSQRSKMPCELVFFKFHSFFWL